MKNKLKKLAFVAMSVISVFAMSIVSFALEDETTAATTDTVLQTALTGVQSDIVSKLAIVLPIALGIFAIGFGIKWAMKYFRSLSK